MIASPEPERQVQQRLLPSAKIPASIDVGNLQNPALLAKNSASATASRDAEIRYTAPVGRFDSTVPFYARYREPYPASFFREVAQRLGLEGGERLADLGCGPAPLAVGFAPYVSEAVGVDVETEMLEAARVEAARAGVHVDLIQARIEDLPEDIGVFQAVTIGRALHWFDRDEALATLDRIVAPGGWIAICGTHAFGAAIHGLSGKFHEIRRAWSSDPEETRYHIDFEEWFRGSRFRKLEDIEVTESHQVTLPDLIGRALSMSTTSPEVLGDRRPAFEAALREALEPLSANGVFDERISAAALILR
jgi:SAM-dependent methyltransferase